MKDKEVIYRKLTKVFYKTDKKLLYVKIVSLSEKKYDKVERSISLVKKVKEMKEIW